MDMISATRTWEDVCHCQFKVGFTQRELECQFSIRRTSEQWLLGESGKHEVHEVNMPEDAAKALKLHLVINILHARGRSQPGMVWEHHTKVLDDV